MRFFLNMHVQKKSHVDMQNFSCQHENHMSTCKSHVNMQHLFLMERSTDGEDGFGEEMDETRASEREGCRSSEGSDFENESEGEDGLGPEGSDFAAEEGYEEGGPEAEEGYEEVWDEVQEALSTMGHEEFDETAEADLCARSQASRLSSASSQASVRS